MSAWEVHCSRAYTVRWVPIGHPELLSKAAGKADSREHYVA
eukprot:CAMPEP_0170409362 /NCGR_PEP_ID=MMETSP0117_2-20130122/29299_1 /TAXON_ID=400756 /ORGANISM="Durinskia baltica, Strain CSIRO CS-38" /LENGTH=40 /DNA_ID= /DNA_START= /DNA_END= /DNA_ORIENTATION=